MYYLLFESNFDLVWIQIQQLKQDIRMLSQSFQYKSTCFHWAFNESHLACFHAIKTRCFWRTHLQIRALRKPLGILLHSPKACQVLPPCILLYQGLNTVHKKETTQLEDQKYLQFSNLLWMYSLKQQRDWQTRGSKLMYVSIWREFFSGVSDFSAKHWWLSIPYLALSAQLTP